MDKLLLTALFALLAGFLTAAISLVKLVNDKEGRISDYREQWTIAVRECFSNLISGITALAQLLEERAFRLRKCKKIIEIQAGTEQGTEKVIKQSQLDYQWEMVKKTNDTIHELIRDIYRANSLIRLHFKMNDPGFIGVESKTDFILGLLRSIENPQVAHDVEQVRNIRGQIAVSCSEILALSRLTIKTEWEKVKQGEPAYIATKKIAKWAGVIFLFVFLTVGIHAYIATHKGSAEQTVSSPTSKQADTKSEQVPAQKL
jgi:hypothetical protein